MQRLRICQVVFFFFFKTVCRCVTSNRCFTSGIFYTCLVSVMSMMRALEGPKHVVDCNGMQWRCSGTTNKRMLLCSEILRLSRPAGELVAFQELCPCGVSCKQDLFAFHPKRGFAFNRLEPTETIFSAFKSSLICL